jgi:hypothetical protein
MKSARKIDRKSARKSIKKYENNRCFQQQQKKKKKKKDARPRDSKIQNHKKTHKKHYKKSEKSDNLLIKSAPGKRNASFWRVAAQIAQKTRNVRHLAERRRLLHMKRGSKNEKKKMREKNGKMRERKKSIEEAILDVFGVFLEPGVIF